MIIKNLIKLPFFKRLIPSIFKRYIFFTGNYFKSKNISGISYFLDTRYLIDRNFYLRENYEDYLYSIANKLIILNKVNFFSLSFFCNRKDHISNKTQKIYQKFIGK